jgi:hypothetical protein
MKESPRSTDITRIGNVLLSVTMSRAHLTHAARAE